MFTEDLSVFMNAAEFATTCTLNGATVTGIFDSAYLTASVGGFGAASSQPMLTLPSASVPANPVGLSAVINAVTYLVTASEPDGTGLTRLILEAA